jgi:hypothetical protein
MNKRQTFWQGFVLALAPATALLGLVGWSSLAHAAVVTVTLPPAPKDVAESILQFPARARTVVHFNACGREYEYARLVAAL